VKLYFDPHKTYERKHMKTKHLIFSLLMVAFVVLSGCSLGGVAGDQATGDPTARAVKVAWREKIYAYWQDGSPGSGTPYGKDTLTNCEFDASNQLIARKYYMRKPGSSDWGDPYCIEKMTYLSGGLLSSIEANGSLSKVGKYVFYYPLGGYPYVKFYNLYGEYTELIIIKKKSTRTEYALYRIDGSGSAYYAGSTIIEEVTPPSGYDRQLKLTTTNQYGNENSNYLEYIYKKGHLKVMYVRNPNGSSLTFKYTPVNSSWANVNKYFYSGSSGTLIKKYRDLAPANYNLFDPADVFNILNPMGNYYADL
jgi:hypothetical protein